MIGEPLVGNFQGYWRYRVGDYRIVCELQDKELLILVIEVGHRKDVYQ
jgi:mRNA interferase RelE/StbE